MGMRRNDYPDHPDGRTTIHKATYNSWRAMKQRCYDKTYWARKNYADKGIVVCDRWLGASGFSNFLSDMGERPEGMTLDRIDNNKGYYPENCRWADQETQVKNSSRVLNAMVTAEELKNAVCSMSVVYERLKKGWSKEDALYEPIHQWREAKLYGPCPICGKTWKRKDTKYCSAACYKKSVPSRARDAEGHFI